MMRLQILQRDCFRILLAGSLSIITAMPLIDASSASASTAAKKSKQAVTSAETTAQRYAEAMGAGNKVGVSQLDFACQYPLVAAVPHGIKTYPTDSDPVYDSCWQRLREAHTSTLIRTDVGMEVLWPSNGELVFFSEDVTSLSCFCLRDRITGCDTARNRITISHCWKYVAPFGLVPPSTERPDRRGADNLGETVHQLSGSPDRSSDLRSRFSQVDHDD